MCVYLTWTPIFTTIVIIFHVISMPVTHGSVPCRYISFTLVSLCSVIQLDEWMIDDCLFRWHWTSRGKGVCPPKGRGEECLWCITVPGCTLCSTATREEWRRVRVQLCISQKNSSKCENMHFQFLKVEFKDTVCNLAARRLNQINKKRRHVWDHKV